MKRLLLSLVLLVLVPRVWAQNCFPEPTCRFVVSPKTQVVASGDTIAIDQACGSLYRVSAAGAISTSSTLPFNTPVTNNLGCTVVVCNVGANTITVKHVAAFFLTTTGADLSLTANSCFEVTSSGVTGVWFQTSSIVNDS